MDTKRTARILGIDIGSSSSRAGLLDPVTKEFFHVETNVRDPTNIIRYQPGEFSSKCYPFDDGPVYLNGPDDNSRLSVSAKYIFYALANRWDDGFLQYIQEYPPAEPLLRRCREPAFRARLRAGLVGLLTAIRDRVIYCCKVKHVTIQSIVLTIPAQWTLDFEDLYRELVVEVFNRPVGDIFFCAEVEGLAHDLITDHAEELGLQAQSDGTFTLFLDFGGHNTNAAVYYILPGQEGEAKFYRLGQPEGVGGGSESWEYQVGKWCFDNFERHSGGRQLPPEAKKAILDEFNFKKRLVGPETNGRERAFLYELQDDIQYKVNMAPEIVDKLCRDALFLPLSLAKEQIREFAKLGIRGVPLKVIVAGGTAKHPYMQAKLAEFCTLYGLNPPCFSHALVGLSETVMIAKGAVLAHASMTTVTGFMERGAAFGLQMRQRPKNGGSARLWDNTAFFLLDQNFKAPLDNIYLQGDEDIKIVCDPFLHAANGHVRLECFKCYDVLKHWRPSRGYWTFTLSLLQREETFFLALEAEKKSSRRGGKRKRVASQWKFPLYFDGGTSCVLVGQRDKALEELGIDLPWENDEADEEEAALEEYQHTGAASPGHAVAEVRKRRVSSARLNPYRRGKHHGYRSRKP